MALQQPTAFPVLDARRDVSSVLRVRIETRGTGLAEMDLTTLRVHLHGEPTLTSALYDLLGEALVGIALVADKATTAEFLPADALRPVGFGADEEVIPTSPNSRPGYRLLQEYLQFPAKFHFFDLTGLGRCRAQQTIDVLFLFRRSPQSRLSVDKDIVLLGCTPIQNLFYRPLNRFADHRR